MKKILVATDGSCPLLISSAAKLAKKLNLKVKLLHVIETKRVSILLGIRIKEIYDELKKKGEQILEESKKILEAEGIEVETKIREGWVPEEIMEEVKEDKDIAVIFLGAYGKDFLTRKMVGSVTERLVRQVGINIFIPVVITPCRKQEVVE